MFKKSLPNLSRHLAMAMLIAALPLAGCAADKWAEDDTPATPFGGSKNHPIRVVGNHASVANCGDWSMDATSSDNNQLMPNHGCAVQANIAAMAAYPQDLVKARKMSRAPAAPRVAAVQAISNPAAAASSGSSTAVAAPTSP